MSDLWPRAPAVAWTGIPSGWLLYDLRLLIALQDVIDRSEGPAEVCVVCGVKVAWNEGGTQLHHLGLVQPPRHRPQLETPDRPRRPSHRGVAWSARHQLPGEQ